jgi:hypothetical protein
MGAGHEPEAWPQAWAALHRAADFPGEPFRVGLPHPPFHVLMC